MEYKVDAFWMPKRWLTDILRWPRGSSASYIGDYLLEKPTAGFINNFAF